MACHPSFAMLAALREEGSRSASFTRHVHPDPRLYKYHWWIFHADSPMEGAAFLQPAFRMTTHAASVLVGRLTSEGRPFLIYNTRLPRLNDKHVLDPLSARWRAVEWAPAYDDDRDPEIDGYR